MTTLSQTHDFKPNPRPSTETDRRHLLSGSIAPSESASMIDGDRTPRPQSPAPSYRTTHTKTTTARRSTVADTSKGPYKGFPSEEAYLNALRAWAEGKKYLSSDTQLDGFYGHTTMQEYAERPGVEIGIRRKWRERKARKEEKKGLDHARGEGRRATVA